MKTQTHLNTRSPSDFLKRSPLINTLVNTLVAICILASAPLAHAKRGPNREGFNFGLSVLTTGDDSKLYPSRVSDKTRQVSNSVSGYSPFLGYSFDVFAIGMKFGRYNETLSTEEHLSSDPTKRNKLSSSTSMSTASLFSRINFGGYFFLEAGAGVYKESIDIDNEYVSDLGDGIFEGKSEIYNISGSGIGSHFGGGFEVPMAKSGFFLTGEYMRQAYSVRESNTSLSVGQKQSARIRSALNLGLAYYFD